jgi:hypothetical protein
VYTGSHGYVMFWWKRFNLLVLGEEEGGRRWAEGGGGGALCVCVCVCVDKARMSRVHMDAGEEG